MFAQMFAQMFAGAQIYGYQFAPSKDALVSDQKTDSSFDLGNCWIKPDKAR